MNSSAVTSSPALAGVVLEYANRGVRLQVLLRAGLVVFIALTLVLVPPEEDAVAGYAIVGAYAIWAAWFAAWAWRGGSRVARRAWLGLLADLPVLASVTLVAATNVDRTWTDDVLVHGFFVIPVLAATQLRPGVCAAVVIPTVLVFLGSSVTTQTSNDEPWASIALRTAVLAGVGAACVVLSRIQRSRVAAIGGLVRDRTGLLDDLMHLEDRERRELSERLHDGALQYVLAARQELDDVRDGADLTAVARVEQALVESSRLLRSTVTELHPAVLDHAGLARAVRELAAAQSRPDLSISVELGDWPDGVRTTVDALLFSAARELLSNVVKHAGADSATVALGLYGESARLVVADDGRGIDADARQRGLDDGHIGLHSQTLRVEAAGGTLTIAGGPSGTVAIVEVSGTLALPAHPSAPSAPSGPAPYAAPP